MLDRISAQSSTLVSTVCMWLEDGNFAGFEGTGCCPMNCTHVWNYEQQLAHLFPELERNMRHIDLEVQQNPDGGDPAPHAPAGHPAPRDRPIRATATWARS